MSLTLQKVTRNLSLQRSVAEEDSDEDKPLSSLLLDRPTLDIPKIDFDNLNTSVSPKLDSKVEEEDEDEGKDKEVDKDENEGRKDV